MKIFKISIYEHILLQSVMYDKAMNEGFQSITISYIKIKFLPGEYKFIEKQRTMQNS